MTVLLGPTPCVKCKRPVTVVRRPVVVMCVWCDLHTSSTCQCATAHAHTVPDGEWAVVDPDDVTHRCAAA